MEGRHSFERRGSERGTKLDSRRLSAELSHSECSKTSYGYSKTGRFLCDQGFQIQRLQLVDLGVPTTLPKRILYKTSSFQERVGRNLCRV